MTIPFLSFLKKKPRSAMPAYVAAEKNDSQRLSKTVMPNATRTMGPQDSFEGMETAPAPTVRPFVSFVGAGRGTNLPPAVALALEPRVERTISVELADVVAQMPPGLTRPLAEGDVEHILLSASEVEKGMASGKPTVSAYTIYQQAPEIFLQTLTSADMIQVPLPFKKVLDQLSQMQVRSDQNQEQIVPQLQTPFLQVTLEDDERFGTVTPPAQLASHDELPVGRIELATAETLAAAQPEAAASDKYVPRPGMTFPAPQSKHGNGAVSKPNKSKSSNGSAPKPAPAEEKPVIPTSIAFKLSPKGTDAPATERVPASTGASVPTSAPTRIPFKVGEPAAGAPEDSEPWLTKDNFAGEAAGADFPEAIEASPSADAGNLKLLLKPILQNVLPLQLTREIVEVSDDAVIEVPFSLLQPQLATGRICLAPEAFAKFLPEEYRDLFDPTMSEAPVALPLQEVLKHLPGASLRMRADQVEPEEGENFVTPFSTKAEEDAQRFKVPPTPVRSPASAAPAEVSVAKVPSVEKAKDAPIAMPVVESPSVAEIEEIAEENAPVVDEKPAVPFKFEVPKSAPAPAAPGRTPLQSELDTDDEVDAKAVVAHVTKMAGVKACAVVFGDGLSLAGNLPEQYQADGLCAMAPSLMQRTESHMAETQLGAFRSMTLFCAKASVTFFMQNSLCLAAVHDQKELSSEIRERLARVLLELSHKYSHSA